MKVLVCLCTVCLSVICLYVFANMLVSTSVMLIVVCCNYIIVFTLQIRGFYSLYNCWDVKRSKILTVLHIKPKISVCNLSQITLLYREAGDEKAKTRLARDISQNSHNHRHQKGRVAMTTEEKGSSLLPVRRQLQQSSKRLYVKFSVMKPMNTMLCFLSRKFFRGKKLLASTKLLKHGILVLCPFQ